MGKNKVQFQAGYSLFQLFQNYGTEAQCYEALFKLRWPSEFQCPECGCHHYCFLKARKLYQCSQCHSQTSLISRTIFEQTKLPLSKWFLATYINHPIRNRPIRSGTETGSGCFLQYGLEYEAQDHASHEGTG